MLAAKRLERLQYARQTNSRARTLWMLPQVNPAATRATQMIDFLHKFTRAARCSGLGLDFKRAYKSPGVHSPLSMLRASKGKLDHYRLRGTLCTSALTAPVVAAPACSLAAATSLFSGCRWVLMTAFPESHVQTTSYTSKRWLVETEKEKTSSLLTTMYSLSTLYTPAALKAVRCSTMIPGSGHNVGKECGGFECWMGMMAGAECEGWQFIVR